MTAKEIHNQIISKKSFLCVGLDTDLGKIPEHLKTCEDPIFEFNKSIIDATHDIVIAYKPNIAFYEALGPKGMISLKKTIDYIPENILVIADAKRGDIGNTSKLYAKSFFEYYNADAITVNPYMGSDSVKPFLEYDNKWVIILGLTSNSGSADFQHLELSDGTSLYETVISVSTTYGSADQIMFVVGATQTEYIERIRALAPNHFFLVPGIGAQGGSLEEVCQHGLNNQVGLIVNSSRGIIYAGSDINFASSARLAALKIQQQMEAILDRN